MNWFFLALICAFTTACCDAISKRIMEQTDEWLTGTVVLGISSLVVLPVFLSGPLKPVSVDLIVLLAIALPLEIGAYYLFLSSIRMAPLSLTVPLLAFTPVLTIFTSAILLGESITLSGGLGISMVTAGAYILNANLIRQNIWAPIKAIFFHPGSRRMLLVAIIWSVTSSLGKKGVELYGAVPFGCVLLFGDFFVFALISIFRIKTGRRPAVLRSLIGLSLVAGLLMAVAEVTHFLSLSMAPVSYMISVKRLSLVFGVVLGWLFFGEEQIRYRLAGACAMVAGVFFVYG
ncbi:MAG TPA: DMT family transporter [Desulfomonilaceae bacterium]|nr:DMT family transporter [Desulfomonilaceae bacterium]